MRFALVIIFIFLRLIIIVLRANPISIRVVLLGSRALRRISISVILVIELIVLPSSRALYRISISIILVIELIVKKLLYYLVRVIRGKSNETLDILSL